MARMDMHFIGAPKRVGIVGLGLIGGSFARAYAVNGIPVVAYDPNEETMDAARVDTIEGELADETIATCDLIVLATYPNACLEWLEAHAEAIAAAQGEDGSGPIVIDTAGIKAAVCERAFAIAAEHGFRFVGAHPMAGTEHSGFAHARADLFSAAPMVLTPPPCTDSERLELLDRVHMLLEPVGFGRFSVTTPEVHDRVIGYTSQLCHIVSNAFIKSPTAQEHHGFSAGSYRDLTRVAHLNAPMWAELMLDNADNLACELDTLIDALAAYRDALRASDHDTLQDLLAEGDRIKRALDANTPDNN